MTRYNVVRLMLKKYVFWTIIGLIIGALLVLFYAFDRTPFGMVSFVLLSVVLFFVAYYRPREMFWVFLVTLPLEMIIVSPETIPFSLRPYQWLGAIVFLATALLWLQKKLDFKLLSFKKICFICQLGNKKNCAAIKPERAFNWIDRLVFIFPLFAFLALINAPNKELSFKLAIVLVSFVVLYWLVRNFTQSTKERLEAIWFFLVSLDIVIIFSLYQALAARFGWQSFQVMTGRINSTFVEPDWLGLYLALALAIMFWTKLYVDYVEKEVKCGTLSLRRVLGWMINWSIFWVIFALFLTVARSAWIAVLVLFVSYLFFTYRKGGARKASEEGAITLALTVIAIGIIMFFGLSSFHFANRAASSISGMQKITISCFQGSQPPETIKNIGELQNYDCRHINLEEIESEEMAGFVIYKTYRPDPNVNIRKENFSATWQAIKEHPIIGQGLGTSRIILGQDGRGAALNSSNIFLEVWLSMGLLGLGVFLTFFLAPTALVKKQWFDSGFKENAVMAIILLTTVAFFFPNLFNSGLLLGIFWVWLAVAVGATGSRKL